MTDDQAFKIWGERAASLTQNPEIQREMVELAEKNGRDYAVRWLYMVAAGTLVGTR